MKMRTTLWFVIALVLGLLFLGYLFAWLNADYADFAWSFIHTKVEVYHLSYGTYPPNLIDPRFQALAEKAHVSVVPVNDNSIYSVRYLGLFRRHKVTYIKYSFINDSSAPTITMVSPPDSSPP